MQYDNQIDHQTDRLKLQNRSRGSIIAGAAGDALGYTVEFLSRSRILKEYGRKGITRLERNSAGEAEFSDDTQMTLFTADGLLMAKSEEITDLNGINSKIKDAYLVWYATQNEPQHSDPRSRLSGVSGLWTSRAPGNTCLSSLFNLANGYPNHNNSKGCGGVMRVAPIGIFAAAHPDLLPLADAALLAAQSSELTHHHPASSLASALQAVVVAKCMVADELDRSGFIALVKESIPLLKPVAPGRKDIHTEFEALINLALTLADSTIDEIEALSRLGLGWVGDEAIAIALFCVSHHISDIKACLECAVNHDGDSDSTGAIAGNIIGALKGYSAIPHDLAEGLELQSLLLEMADRLVE